MKEQRFPKPFSNEANDYLFFKHGIAPATPSAIERIESSLLSYGNDMTLENNPFEIDSGNIDAPQGTFSGMVSETPKI